MIIYKLINKLLKTRNTNKHPKPHFMTVKGKKATEDNKRVFQQKYCHTFITINYN